MIDIEILVNKRHILDEEIIPPNLVEPVEFINKSCKFDEVENKILVDNRLYEAFKELDIFLKQNGYKVFIDSGYRSFRYQAYILNMYREKYGKEKGELLCAYPGQSEHQLGLAVDLGYEDENGKYISSITEDSNVYEFLKDNSYKFGFIIRYPKGKEEITKYSFEPWHFRYVGRRLSKILYDNDITLDEYYENKEKYDR